MSIIGGPTLSVIFDKFGIFRCGVALSTKIKILRLALIMPVFSFLSQFVNISRVIQAFAELVLYRTVVLPVALNNVELHI